MNNISQLICRRCSAQFELHPEDLLFYQEASPVVNGRSTPFPNPSLCPNCRRMERLAFRNSRNLYRRKCDLSGANIISIYSPDKLCVVYKAEEWWKDSWDPMDYGKRYTPDRRFFEQFEELRASVPLQALSITNCENCDFNNAISNSKNCYLVFNSTNCEDTYYSDACADIKDCVDIWWSNSIELSAYISCSSSLFHCIYCDRCSNSTDLIFCRDCVHCSNCFGCANLQHKEYCIFNIQYTKEEYLKTIEQFNRGSYNQIQRLRKQVSEFFLSQPYKAFLGEFAEDCSGDMIYDSKNCRDCYTVVACEDSRYLFECGRSKNCMDLEYSYDCEGGVYQAVDSTGCFNSAFLINAHNCSDSYYLHECYHLNNCFGCAGLRNKEYCILNVQYTKDDYYALLEKIIKRMDEDGEWGCFFPLETSLFGYNETTAMLFSPLDRESVLNLGAKWSDFEKTPLRSQQIISPNELPDHIKDVSDAITQSAIQCKATGKPFRITTAELGFYRKLQIPLPRLHPDYRYLKMIKTRNPCRLWERRCAQCNCSLLTTFNPDRQEIIYCDNCYENEFR